MTFMKFMIKPKRYYDLTKIAFVVPDYASVI